MARGDRRFHWRLRHPQIRSSLVGDVGQVGTCAVRANRRSAGDISTRFVGFLEGPIGNRPATLATCPTRPLPVAGQQWFAAPLAAIGTYGVAAYAVAQRTREIGIRVAMGALPRQIFYLMGRWTMALIAAGIALGLLLSLALAGLLESQLWGVAPYDPATFAAVSALLALAAVLACLLPVRKALRVDPAVALRRVA